MYVPGKEPRSYITVHSLLVEPAFTTFGLASNISISSGEDILKPAFQFAVSPVRSPDTITYGPVTGHHNVPTVVPCKFKIHTGDWNKRREHYQQQGNKSNIATIEHFMNENIICKI